MSSLARRLSGAPTIFVLLAGWTLFSWTTRVRNVLGDDELAGLDRAWRLGVSVAFVALALAVLGAVAARRGVLAAHMARVLAVAGILWWPVRGVSTLLADFSIGFKIVHTVLAVVTVVLGVLVLRAGSDRSLTAPVEDEYQLKTSPQ